MKTETANNERTTFRDRLDPEYDETRFDPNYNATRSGIVTDNGTEVVVSKDARSAVNAFKLKLDDKFHKLSTEIGRLRIEGGATRVHYDNLLTMIVDLKNSIQQFNFGIPDSKPIDVHDPNYHESKVVNTLDGRKVRTA